MTRKPEYDGGSLQDLVAAADDSVKMALGNGRGLREFLATIDKLAEPDLDLIVEQAVKLLEGFYVHLPMKRAMHAVDPLQRLRLLRRRIPQLTSEIAFHHEMTEIFTSLRDLHTNYILPAHFAQMVAFLPFRVATCFDKGLRRYVMAEGMGGFAHPTFVPGVNLTYWNGIPIDRAVEIAASYHAGSNPAARHARGVAGLAKRAMNMSPPPDEEWVIVGYDDLNGQPQQFRAEWTITGLPPEVDGAMPEMPTEVAAAFGLDLEGDTFRRINKMLFDQDVIAKKRRMESVRKGARDMLVTARSVSGDTVGEGEAAAAETAAASTAVQGTESIMPDVFSARVVTVDGHQFGYIRISTFSVSDDMPFVNEFLRLIELPEMPKDGLIIDVRGNGGGLIWAGERLLQLLTPRPIEPCRVQFINTSVNLQLCQNVQSLQNWKPSLARALETGAAFSAAFPITPPERCNDIGQRYYGPIVLVTDARCYSTTDIFAAGFQDHKIGTILGTEDNTGAGGANVWTLELVRQFFQSAGLAPPLQSLPKGAGMRVAIRRTLRVGDEAGTELEDLGVKPNQQHQLTRNDVLNRDTDLIAAAAAILVKRNQATPPISFNVSAVRAGKKLKLEFSTGGVDYVDVFVEQRPRVSRNIVAGALKVDLPEKNSNFLLPSGAVNIEIRGYANGQLVSCRRLAA
ncbi:S41 family peptidase [Mesorhizobium sp. M0320]|uniref:S41 family peptidase n=1 Tax=unclassified Mesorhizobium TaxID=325217 RepID=UPI00333BC6AB